MTFHLIVTTLGRSDALRDFLASLEAQSFRGFRVVLVDQSGQADVADVVESYTARLPMARVASASGASRGRNAGLDVLASELDATAADEIVAFPDDDCRYPPDLLGRVAAFFAGNEAIGGLTGRALDDGGRPTTAAWDREAGPITPKNVWRRGVEFTTFLRYPVVAAVGKFDPELGPGAETGWSAGEGTDYLLRALGAAFELRYEPSVIVHHPEKRTPADVAKTRAYGMGMARVLAKHRSPLAFRVGAVVRPLAGAALALARGRPAKARYHWALFRGRLAGSRR